MKKLVVIILGFLVSSILPIEVIPRTMLIYVIFATALLIVIACCIENDVGRFVAIFFASGVLGYCSSVLSSKWCVLSQKIPAVILVLLAIAITVILGIKSENERVSLGKRTKKSEKDETEEE